MYCLLTFTGILLLLENRPSFFVRYIGSLFCFGLSYATRSNGFVNIGYIVFFCLLKFIFRRDQEHQNKCTVIFRQPMYFVIKEAISFVLKLVFAVVAISLPVYLHGRRQQILFCSQGPVPSHFARYAAENGLITMGQIERIGWCGSIFHVLANGGDHIPYTLHALFMACGALFIYNSELHRYKIIQVLTRMLFSSSPFPYIVFARWISDITPQLHWLFSIIYMDDAIQSQDLKINGHRTEIMEVDTKLTYHPCLNQRHSPFFHSRESILSEPNVALRLVLLVFAVLFLTIFVFYCIYLVVRCIRYQNAFTRMKERRVSLIQAGMIDPDFGSRRPSST
uniref:GPI mannosyltransferase 2 n=1 Tax=Heterorhabditis bacteriophora TaxID=37862 RepID=A0A1I7XEA9_HETBA